MNKQTILTGIRANNDLHIGNYFGAMMPIIDMAKQRSDEFNVNLFIPDLHSITTPIDYDGLSDAIMQNARMFTAAGLPLDNDSIHLYRQSHVPAHSELTWILDCFTGFGEMRRMTQFKEKNHKTQVERGQAIHDSVRKTIVENDDSEIDLEQLGQIEASVGLFNYPVLMAADILIYGTSYVPVGEDQTQHLEFTRDIAERMNKKFGELFVVPEPVKKQHEFFGNDQGLRIKDLADPTKKMSKSADSDRGVIFLSDSPEDAVRKIMTATTDDLARVDYNKERQPGISNLIEILTLLRQANSNTNITLESTVAELRGQERYGDFKQIVANEMEVFLKGFQSRYAMVDDQQVLAKLETSETNMNEVANQNLYRVQQAVGLRRKN